MEEIKKSFQHLKVLRKKVSVDAFGWFNSVSVSKHCSHQAAAQQLDEQYKEAERKFSELGNETAKKLKELCQADMLPHTGNKTKLREILTRHWMKKWVAEKSAEQKPKAGGEPAGEKPSDTTEIPGGTSQNAKEGASGAQSVLANLEPLQSDGAQDVSHFFTDARGGQPLISEDADNTLDIVNAGVDGIIPVAAYVKVKQGVDDDATQIALFIGGSGLCMHMTWVVDT